MNCTRKSLFALAALVTALCSAALVAACGGGSGGESTNAQAVETSFDPANFGNPAAGNNPYLPIIAGNRSVRQGTTIVGGREVPHQVVTTITDVEREIDGVRTVAVLDYELDGGQVSQVSLDYVAEDMAANVWLLGGYTEEYEGGRFVSAIDDWLAGVRGAKAGVLVQGDPMKGTPPYDVAQPDKEEGDVAQVVDVGARQCVPFKCFDDVLIVREGKASEPDNELKYYARDVGQIDNVPQGASVHKDVERLINLTKLSPKALAEVSAQVLQLDRHAIKTAPNTFGKFPPGERS